MNKYFMFIFFICVGSAAYGMEKEFKNTTNAPITMTRQEVKAQACTTEPYNKIPDEITNAKVARWTADKAHGDLERIARNTKLTSPTNKFVPQISKIQTDLHAVISPNGKKEPKQPFPQNIFTLSKRLRDTVTFAKPLYDSESANAATLAKIQEAAQQLEEQASKYAQELDNTNKENIFSAPSKTKQQSLHSFIPLSRQPKKVSPRRRPYKRRKDDTENNHNIYKFLLTKKAKTESQEAPEIINIEDENTPPETSTQPSAHERLARFRHNPTARKALFND